jgi:pimeloyl-CoA synthetase
MSEEAVVFIDDKEIKVSDLTPQQLHHQKHIISLRNKIGNHQFEIDDLLPSLQFHENALIESTKEVADKVLKEEGEEDEVVEKSLEQS